MPSNPAPTPTQRLLQLQRPLRVLLPLLLAVLLAHALLLGLLPLGVGGGWQGGVKPALQVRQIVVPAPAAAEPAPAAPAVAAALPEVAPPPPPAPAASQPLPPVAAIEPAVSAASAASAAEPAITTAAAPPPPPAPPASEGGGEAVPVYATRMPAAVRLRYDLKRGALAGNGELAWQPADGRYLLTMEGSAFSINVLNWRSEGGFDAAGIAPERFVDRRRGRDVRAANFQRDKGLITFSGPQVEYPLHPGAQDRLSWMLQLAAIVAADPPKYGPGARISLFVAGARGDADVWTFSVEASESLDLPVGPVANALRLRREPRKPYDTLGEVWLDPARTYLPVRVRLSVPQADDSTEFLLREAQPL